MEIEGEAFDLREDAPASWLGLGAGAHGGQLTKQRWRFIVIRKSEHTRGGFARESIRHSWNVSTKAGELQLGWAVGGHVDGVVSALIGGALTGAGLGLAKMVMAQT